MSKVLFVFEQDMPTVSIMRDEFTHLSGKWGIESVFKRLLTITPQDIDGADILILIRPEDILSWKITERAKAAGCMVIVFTDDDLLSLPPSVATIPWRKRGLQKVLSRADGVLSSSRYILKKYGPMTAGKRTAVSDSIVDMDDIEPYRGAADHDPIRIVYAASSGHIELFQRYILPVLPRLLERYEGHLAFYFVGLHPVLKDYDSRMEIHYVDSMPLKQYREYMRSQAFDIAIAPLNSDDFSKCKYFNKFIEYTLQGTMGIYSATEPYTYVVRDGENGLLAENTADGWFSAFSRAIDDRALRERCVDAARTLLTEEFSEERVISKLLEQLPELKTPRTEIRQACKPYRLQRAIYYLSRPLDLFYLTVYFLRRTGVSGVAEKIREHMKRVYR